MKRVKEEKNKKKNPEGKKTLKTVKNLRQNGGRTELFKLRD